MDLVTTILACSLYNDNSIINAMIKVGSQGKPLTISVANEPPKTFTAANQAIQYANHQIQQGYEVDIGLMQIPSRWLSETHTTVSQLLAPCKNLVVASKILNRAMDQCVALQSSNPNLNLQACALSVYISGNPQEGLDYANQVLSYANQNTFNDVYAQAKAKNPKAFTDYTVKVPAANSVKKITETSSPPDQNANG